MIYALEALIGSGTLDADETTRAADQLARNEEVYRQGLATVLADARFTPVGAAAFEGLRRHMNSRGQSG
jgi:hypothetical protein